LLERGLRLVVLGTPAVDRLLMLGHGRVRLLEA